MEIDLSQSENSILTRCGVCGTFGQFCIGCEYFHCQCLDCRGMRASR